MHDIYQKAGKSLAIPAPLWNICQCGIYEDHIRTCQMEHIIGLDEIIDNGRDKKGIFNEMVFNINGLKFHVVMCSYGTEVTRRKTMPKGDLEKVGVPTFFDKGFIQQKGEYYIKWQLKPEYKKDKVKLISSLPNPYPVWVDCHSVHGIMSQNENIYKQFVCIHNNPHIIGNYGSTNLCIKRLEVCVYRTKKAPSIDTLVINDKCFKKPNISTYNIYTNINGCCDDAVSSNDNNFIFNGSTQYLHGSANGDVVHNTVEINHNAYKSKFGTSMSQHKTEQSDTGIRNGNEHNNTPMKKTNKLMQRNTQNLGKLNNNLLQENVQLYVINDELRAQLKTKEELLDGLRAELNTKNELLEIYANGVMQLLIAQSRLNIPITNDYTNNDGIALFDSSSSVDSCEETNYIQQHHYHFDDATLNQISYEYSISNLMPSSTVAIDMLPKILESDDNIQGLNNSIIPMPDDIMEVTNNNSHQPHIGNSRYDENNISLNDDIQFVTKDTLKSKLNTMIHNSVCNYGSNDIEINKTSILTNSVVNSTSNDTDIDATALDFQREQFDLDWVEKRFQIEMANNILYDVVLMDYTKEDKKVELYFKELNRHQWFNKKELWNHKIVDTEPIKTYYPYKVPNSINFQSLKLESFTPLKVRYRDNNWYEAFVNGYCKKSKRYHVEYEDGSEWRWATPEDIHPIKRFTKTAMEQKRINAITNKIIASPVQWDPELWGLEESWYDDTYVPASDVEATRNKYEV